MRRNRRSLSLSLFLSLSHITLSSILSYRQAQAAVLAVLPRLHQLKVPTKRPTDYFAEMAKSDQQMQKVRNKGFLRKAEAVYLSVVSWLISYNVFKKTKPNNRKVVVRGQLLS